MIKPRIKAPVNSYESCKLQIKAGAGEIYVGYLSDRIKKLSFSGRGKESYNKTKTHVNYDEFKKIVKLAHEHGVIVEFAANMPMIGDDPDGGTKFQEYFLEYIQGAILAGVDRLIVGDLGNIIYLRKKGIKLPITASVFLATINSEQGLLLKDLGVDKLCLPHHLTFDEIKSIKEVTGLDVEIFAHFGCSFIESTCSLYHHANEEINFGLPCRGIYYLDKTDESTTILDTGEDCALCALPEIIDAGVTSIKIVGREMDYKLTSTITFIYNYALSSLERGEKMDNIMSHIKERFDFDFWEKGFCDTERCKYINTEYYI